MQNDAALIDQVISGDDDAFDELYRRHASAAWRLGQSVTGTGPEAAAAVSEAYARVFQALRAGRLDRAGDLRSYLVAATRIVALDNGRKGRHASEEPADQTRDDTALVARSFRILPERWRSILWLTEVEGVATEDAAELLGLSPGAAAQLASRARVGLRERFLQAHARGTNAAGCQFTVDRLAAHAGGELSGRHTSKVDEHLAGCADCTDRKAALHDLGDSLRRTALPMPLGLRDTSCSAVKAAMAAPLAPGLTAFPAGPGATARALAWSRTPPTWFQKAVAASSAAVLAVGVVSIGFHDVEGETTEAASDPIGAPESTLSGPVKIDLAGSVAPVLSPMGAVGTALRAVDIPPARPSSDTAAEPTEYATPPSAPAADPGDPITASPSGPGDAVEPPGPVETPTPETPEIPVPDAVEELIPDAGGDPERDSGGDPDPSPVPEPRSVIDKTVDAVAGTIAKVQKTAEESAPASAPTEPVTSAKPLSSAEPVAAVQPEPVTSVASVEPTTEEVGL